MPLILVSLLFAASLVLLALHRGREELLVCCMFGSLVIYWLGILMFIAVDFYKQRKSFLAIFFCVPVFILAGFEHSIADMFYVCSAGAFGLDSLIFILLVLLGNAIGCMLIPFVRKYAYEPAPAA